jgi:hypothetical protein
MKNIIKGSRACIMCLSLFVAITINSNLLQAQVNQSNSGNMYSSPGATGQTGYMVEPNISATKQGSVDRTSTTTKRQGANGEDRTGASTIGTTSNVGNYKDENTSSSMNSMQTDTNTTKSSSYVGGYGGGGNAGMGADYSCSCASQRLGYGLFGASVLGLIILMALYLKERSYHMHHRGPNDLRMS